MTSSYDSAKVRESSVWIDVPLMVQKSERLFLTCHFVVFLVFSSSYLFSLCFLLFIFVFFFLLGSSCRLPSCQNAKNMRRCLLGESQLLQSIIKIPVGLISILKWSEPRKKNTHRIVTILVWYQLYLKLI